MYLCIYVYTYFYTFIYVSPLMVIRNRSAIISQPWSWVLVLSRCRHGCDTIPQTFTRYTYDRICTCNKCARESLDVCGGISNILKFVFPLSSNADKSVERVCKILINADIWDLGAIVEAELRTKRIFCIYIYIHR